MVYVLKKMKDILNVLVYKTIQIYNLQMSKCEHGQQKAYCKKCGGSAYCEHNKTRKYCKECGGSQICEHDKHKAICKICGGSALCEHGKRKTQCKVCGGSAYCEHGKQKARCKACGGSQICEHGKHKVICKECGGSQICKHGKNKARCKQCGGSAYCEHGKEKESCKDCGGSKICRHGKWKSLCKQCGGSQLCKSEWCEVRRHTKYKGYCLQCCIQVCPEINVVRNYKTKENEVVTQIKEAFPDFTWVHDKRVQDGCSKRRPDLLLDMGTHILIIEVDENKHTDYDCSCEHKRLMEISKDLAHRPIVFIRFNPDAYGSIKSPWKTNKNGITVIKNKKEWEESIASLKEQIKYWMSNITDKTVEIIELFY
jgi:hypothetical protein